MFVIISPVDFYFATDPRPGHFVRTFGEDRETLRFGNNGYRTLSVMIERDTKVVL